MTPNEYRKKHRRCATCEYWERNPFEPTTVNPCRAKGVFKLDTEGKFCRVYKPKEFVE